MQLAAKRSDVEVPFMRQRVQGDKMYPWIIKLGGRRFILSAGCAAGLFWLVATHAISDIIFRDSLAITVAVYIAGNVTQKVKEAKLEATE